MAPNYLTLNGVERLRRELDWLDTEERPRIVAEVAYAASLGDRSDNAEYRYGKRRLRQIDGRRRFLFKRLEIARPVDLSQMSGDTVKFGATVVVDDEDGVRNTWKLYGEDEVDVGAGVISWRSPIGRALIGKGAGDEVTFEAPAGKRVVEVIEVRYELQDPLPDDLDFSR